jgi:hypothetical protein
MMPGLRPDGAVRLVLRTDQQGSMPGEIAADLSAAALAGADLWLASDATAQVDRLTRTGPELFDGHEVFAIDDYVDLPGTGEMDIEGLAVEGGYLWIVGAHSARRSRPRGGERDPQLVRRALETVSFDPNRWFLGRIPLVGDAAGRTRLAREAQDETGHRRAGCLKIKRKKATPLVRALLEDEQLRPFMGVPGKENGFDVEGLAVRGERVLLGLRGPVLRGWALLLELRLDATPERELQLLPVEPDGGLVRKHLLDLDGLGVRELCWQGDDLLVLAGPTMDIDGPVRLYRWRQAAAAAQPQVLGRDRVEWLADLPYGRDQDKPEGLFILDEGRPGERLVVVYDAPADARFTPDRAGVDAFVVPGGPGRPAPAASGAGARARPVRTRA